MSGSDRRWPQSERRSGGERRAAERRKRTASGKSSAATLDRRQAQRRSGTDRRDETSWTPVLLEGAGEPSGGSPQAALHTSAVAARELAHAHFSGFKVGASLETGDGAIVTGCNIENASYGLTLCAERVALVKALSEGHSTFTRIAIVTDTDSPTPPCGPCRQLLWEYCGDIDVLLGNLQGVLVRYRLNALLPHPFDRGLL